MRIRLLLLPPAVGLCCALNAQQLSPEVIAVSGGLDRTDHLLLEWTLGQPATSTLVLADGLLTQGFHQPTLQVVPPDPLAGMGAELPLITVYPNPAAVTLNVSISGAGAEAYSILELLDARGRTVAKGTEDTFQPTRQLDLTPLPAGTYHLLVAQPSGELTQTFTVIKLK